MDWLQVFTIAATTIGACWYMHRENLSIWRENAKEMKDFHGRLCTLEERYIRLMADEIERRKK